MLRKQTRRKNGRRGKGSTRLNWAKYLDEPLPETARECVSDEATDENERLVPMNADEAVLIVRNIGELRRL